MPDTGAPWNIPYVDPTDLVRDYPQASEDLADAIADGLDAAGSPGIGSNVVQTVKTDTFTTSSTTFTAITGLSVTITPTSNTSLILVLIDVGFGASGTVQKQMRVMRGATPVYLGDAVGSRTRLWAQLGAGGGQSAITSTIYRTGGIVIDNPATDLATTYSLEARAESTGTLHINRTETDTDSTAFGRSASSITVIEVAA
jgi:hypothetical protein